MARKAIASGIAYTEVTSGSTPASCQFQNVGVHSLMIQYAATLPAAGSLGAIFKPGEGDRLITMSKVWARVVPPSIDPGEIDVTVT